MAATAFAADSTNPTAASTTTATATATAAAPAAGPGSAINPSLVDLLVKKGILTSAEASSLRNASGSAAMEQLLLLLKSKGVVSDTEAADLKAASPDADTMHSLVDIEPGMTTANLSTASGQTKPAEPSGPTVIPAIAPVRVLPLNPPTKDGLLGIKLGSGAILSPYGFIKSTAAYDSYQPYGDDFIKPLFLAGGTNSGPGSNPEFHLKARSTRMGSKFEWPDVSKNITITGQIEADFEGNFSAADNRNVSSIRSNALSLRLAYGRIDWTVAPNSDVFFEAGQDWTIFGSSAMMNLFETTFYGAYFGNLYERSPQMRVGLVQKLGGSRDWKLSPEFAIMMPSEGNLAGTRITCPAPESGVSPVCTAANLGITTQIGQGERQGADNAKPEVESRAVLQFQLDKAPGVVPAQILWSGFYTGRQMTVTEAGVPAAYLSAFPNGVDLNSNGYGNQFAVSLPTRWATFVASAYAGSDLRFFFGGQSLSYYNQAAGLTNTSDGYSVDYNPVVFGKRDGVATVAPQLPVRGYGGFLQAGFPISRWFNADPKGRNAGWQAYFAYGIDAVNATDFYHDKDIGADGGGPIKSTVKAVTVFYKMNPWVQFGFEESAYSSYAVPAISGGDIGVCNATKVGNQPVCNATDWRTEFGPVFTF
ncbi:MAG: hypothetical protein ABR902_06915 [Candidatus Korobacteraceae bacterium]